MADNITVTPGSGSTIAAELLSGSTIALVQRIKMVLGNLDVDGGDVSTTNAMPVTGSTTILGTVTVTGSTAIVGTVTITGSTAIIGTVTITGSTAIIGTVTITGSTSVINTVTITGSTAIIGTVTVTGSTIYVPGIIGNGSATAAATGSAVQITTASVACIYAVLIGKTANAGTIWVGSSTAVTGSGLPLLPLQTQRIDINNLNKIYIAADTAGDGVTYVYFT